MYNHIGAFVLATLAVTLELASFLCLMNKDRSTVNVSWWTNYLFIESEIYFFFTFLSMVPLLLILNSLLDKGVAERKSDQEQLNMPDNFSTRTSINLRDSTEESDCGNDLKDETQTIKT